MKILWLHEKRGSMGGAESNVLASARALQSAGHENHLLFKEGTGRDEQEWERVFASCEQARPGVGPSDFSSQCKPDVIWIHNWPDYDGLPALARGPVPVARMLHDHSTYCLRSYKYHPLTRNICRRPASAACVFPCLAIVQRGPAGIPAIRPGSLGRKFAEIAANRSLRHIVVASDYMLQECLGNGFDRSAMTILPPVSPEGSDAGRTDSSKEGNLLFAGQLIRGKGLDVLLESLTLVSAPWHLDVAGDGPAAGRLRKLAAKLGHGDRVVFHGHLSPSGLEGLYARASVVVFPSMWPEPFGLVGVEAMRRGKPVVGFDVGGVPDWLEDGRNGLLVPWGNRRSLAGALERLIRSPDEARRMGANGLAISRDKFSFARYISSLEGYLGRLASGPLESQK